LKDAINEAFRDWVSTVDETHYLFGTVAGPHPFPALVRDFQKIVGEEARARREMERGLDADEAVERSGAQRHAGGVSVHAVGAGLVQPRPAGDEL